MVLSCVLAALAASPSFDTPEALLSGMAVALSAEDKAKVEALFIASADSSYLFDMAGRRGGLSNLHACLLPAPPGWKGYGEMWAVFHTAQSLEEDHDPVYRVSPTAQGLRLGAEIPENDLAGWRIKHQEYRARLEPESHGVGVSDDLELTAGRPDRALAFRLNDNYRVEGAVAETSDRFVRPQEGDVLRAGSLLIPWTVRPQLRYHFDYSATLPPSNEDEVTPDAAYVTSWWLPSLGRLPFTVEASIEAPSDWRVRAEGWVGEVSTQGPTKTSRFTCDLPISYPKIVGGRYREVSTDVAANGDRFGEYQLGSIDRDRAAQVVRNMKEAASFFEREFGPLPFKGYECWETENYYGVESYSHTILQKDVTHFASHEMGHSYFGGLAPCPYVDDSWNEGVTQYVDSVLLHHDQDRSLENGLRTLDLGLPLSHMPVPWANGSATYYRGCYVMKMLEAEIGASNVVAGLRAIVRERVGRDTRWDDLRPYFERTGGNRLDWFWRQWIDGARFPSLSTHVDRTVKRGGQEFCEVTVTQSGTGRPFDLRFALVTRNGPSLVRLARRSAKFIVPGGPGVRLQVFPFTLARVGT